MALKDVYDINLEKEINQKISQTPILTTEEEHHLFQMLKDADKKERAIIEEKLVLHNLRLVRHIVYEKYYLSKIPFMDLFQIGCIGLLVAIRNFDMNRSKHFFNFGKMRIMQAINNYYTKYGDEGIICPSVQLLNHIKRYKSANTELTATLKRRPTLIEVATVLEMPVPKLAHICNIASGVLSFDQLIDPSTHTYLKDLIPTEEIDLDRNVFQAECHQLLQEAIEVLTERQKEILLQRYPLDPNVDAISQTNLAKKLGVKRQAVHQTETGALKRLQKVLAPLLIKEEYPIIKK